jgi:hypothetical protein
MACGGSSFGLAYDNCVFITPEVDNAQWATERMPSKRMMMVPTLLLVVLKLVSQDSV